MNDGSFGHHDPAFIERLKARDEQAFNEFVTQYQHRLFSFVLRSLGNPQDAEDLVQEVFVKVFKAIDQFRGEAKLSTWVYQITINVCRNRADYLRRRATNRQEVFDDLTERRSGGRHVPSLSSIPRPDEAIEGMQIERLIQRTIHEMDEDFRYPLLLRDVEDLTYDEIAQVTGLPLNTVRSRIHRARQQLRTAIEANFGEKQP